MGLWDFACEGEGEGESENENESESESENENENENESEAEMGNGHKGRGKGDGHAGWRMARVTMKGTGKADKEDWEETWTMGEMIERRERGPRHQQREKEGQVDLIGISDGSRKGKARQVRGLMGN